MFLFPLIMYSVVEFSYYHFPLPDLPFRPRPVFCGVKVAVVNVICKGKKKLTSGALFEKGRHANSVLALDWLLMKVGTVKRWILLSAVWWLDPLSE